MLGETERETQYHPMKRQFMSTNVKPIKTEKLTKRFLMELPEGAYLVSNVYEQKGKPAFAEKVSPPPERNKQWQKIVDARANHRLCDVFKTKKEYEAWSKTKYTNLNERNSDHMGMH